MASMMSVVLFRVWPAQLLAISVWFEAEWVQRCSYSSMIPISQLALFETCMSADCMTIQVVVHGLTHTLHATSI